MKKIKYLFHLLICILISFVCIYLFVFAGGWKLIESSDILSIEFAASIVVGIIIFIVYEISRRIDADIKNLENQIDDLQKQIDILNQSMRNDIK